MFPERRGYKHFTYFCVSNVTYLSVGDAVFWSLGTLCQWYHTLPLPRSWSAFNGLVITCNGPVQLSSCRFLFNTFRSSQKSSGPGVESPFCSPEDSCVTQGTNTDTIQLSIAKVIFEVFFGPSPMVLYGSENMFLWCNLIESSASVHWTLLTLMQ